MAMDYIAAAIGSLLGLGVFWLLPAYFVYRMYCLGRRKEAKFWGIVYFGGGIGLGTVLLALHLVMD